MSGIQFTEMADSYYYIIQELNDLVFTINQVNGFQSEEETGYCRDKPDITRSNFINLDTKGKLTHGYTDVSIEKSKQQKKRMFRFLLPMARYRPLSNLWIWEN
ncbi:hypothetical protein EJ377_17085 [Chryseobacterium arthrosphaerae]|uniref:Uncharacterized protein n=1 Tax=Chryseobacterium arthrosphaerae TaxID=651561 RepID=A0A432DSP7_9FLAO|nr:hypothetical protein EJ377_17085 [Chryseobacterium arthrosphaerae]